MAFYWVCVEKELKLDVIRILMIMVAGNKIVLRVINVNGSHYMGVKLRYS